MVEKQGQLEMTITADAPPNTFVLGGNSTAKETDIDFNEKIENNALPKFLEGEIKERLSVICLVGMIIGFVFPKV